MLGGDRDRREQRDGLEHRHDVVLDAWPDGEAVGEEHRIQLAAFGDAAEFLEVFDVEHAVRRRAGVSPRRLVVAHAHEETR